MTAPERMEPPGRVSGDDSDAAVVVREVGALLADLHLDEGRPVRLTSDLTRDLGLDSLSVVELHDRIEHACGVRLPERVLAEATTPAAWVEAVRRARTGGPAAVAEPEVVPAPRGPAEPWPEDAPTLNEALAWHAATHPDLTTIRVLGEDLAVTDEITYGDLDREARLVAESLIAEKLAPGERVALMLPTGRSYFTVFMGVLLAGGVPVPLYPPSNLAELEEHLRRQARVLENAGATVLVTVSEARLAARLLRTQVPSLERVRTPEALTAPAKWQEPLPARKADDLALIQYTSGSTGDPKGVPLTHAQLLKNIASMGKAFEVNSADVFVSWLPLYHDLGLIGAWLAGMCFGFLSVIMSPLTFLARPVSWLEVISRFSGTISAGPNFAYETCVERVAGAELAQLDLSHWRAAINGSEPVVAATLQRFAERFSEAGFHEEAACPAYGLAEVGLGLTVTPLARGARVDVIERGTFQRSQRAVPAAAGSPDTITVVSCGRPFPGYEVRVADPHGDELPDRQEGGVECRGPSLSTGYYHNEAASSAIWRRGWMRTGDLGYIADGELFLTGRDKDLVVHGGRKLHPEDLEQALATMEGVRGGVAVFGDPDPTLGTERLIVVAGTTLQLPGARADLEARIARTAVEVFGTAPDRIVLTPPSAVLRTPSGKIRRAAIRDALHAGTLGKGGGPVVLQLARFAWSELEGSGLRLAAGIRARGFAAYAWALTGAIGIPLWFAVQLPVPLRARWAMTRWAGWSLAALMGIGVEVDGALPPRRSGAVVVANHQSFVDGLALILASRQPLAFVGSSDLERQAVVGTFMRRIGCEFVPRDHAEQSAQSVQRLARVLAGGGKLVIFSEGGITRAPGLRPFRLGAFAVAASTTSPVVPVGIRGTRDIVRPGSYLPRRGRIRIVIGSPVFPAGPDFAAQVELRDAVRPAIAELSGEPEAAEAA